MSRGEFVLSPLASMVANKLSSPTLMPTSTRGPQSSPKNGKGGHLPFLTFMRTKQTPLVDEDCATMKSSRPAPKWTSWGEVLSVPNSSADVTMFPAPNPGSNFGCFSIDQQVPSIYNPG